MAASYQLTSGFDVLEGGAGEVSGHAIKGLPRFVDRILHASKRRLRFSVESNFGDFDNFERHLQSLQNVARVRSNRWAHCYIVVFKDDSPLDPLQWMSSLPQISKDIPVIPESAQSPQSSAIEGIGEDEEEKFVPTRIILPVCSLGLAILAGPLSLPPLAIGAFIIGSAHLSFRRAWSGLKNERKINVDFLDALAVLLHSLEGFLLGPAMMITMIEGGEAVRDATQRIANSSNTDLVSSLQSDVRLITDDGEVIVLEG